LNDAPSGLNVWQGPAVDDLLFVKQLKFQCNRPADQLSMESIGAREMVVLLLLFLAIFFGVAILIFIAVTIKRSSGGMRQGDTPRCSFCLKPQGQVKKLIAGPSAFICNECVSICNEIVSNDRRAESIVKFP
jgi:hypothetical protein